MFRRIAASELARVLGVLSHPARLQIIEELRGGERDVGSLVEVLRISHSGVSQHLSRLRSQHLVVERREGRHIYYRLQDEELAEWLVQGLQFVLSDVERTEQIGAAVQKARKHWSTSP
jgi:DNA-binding transcriptional ArsR family regulator